MDSHNLTFENHADHTSNRTLEYEYEEAYMMTFCFDDDTIDKLINAVGYMNIIFDVVSIPLNAWILVAILTSTDLRSRIRNMMLAGICVQGLFDCIIALPSFLHYYLDLLHYFSSFHTSRAHYVIYFFSEFVSNWNIVTLLALVLFTLYGSSVTLGGWNRLITQVVTYCLLLWPWLFSPIIVIPTILSNYEEFSVTLDSNVTICAISLVGLEKALYVINIGVPAFLSAPMLAAIIFLNRKRTNTMTSRGDIAMRQLIDGEFESEPSTPYIAIVVVFFVSDFGSLIHVIDSSQWSGPSFDCALFTLRQIVNCLLGLRDVLLPLSFLLFPEVRYRAKKVLQLMGRRRRRGSDVTISYVKAS